MNQSKQSLTYRTDIPNTTDVLELLTVVDLWQLDLGHDHLENALIGSTTTLSVYDGQQLVGICQLLTDKVAFCYVSLLAVHPLFQYQGIGGKLLESSIFSLVSPLDHMLLTVLPENGTSAFYEKLGFKKDGIFHTLTLSCFRSFQKGSSG